MKKVYCFFLLLILNQTIYSQTCNANAGLDISICDGDGSNNNYTYLDGGLSTVNDGDIEFEWTVLNTVGDGSDDETLVLSRENRQEPRFKYPEDLATDTEFFVQLRIFNETNTCESFDTISVFIQSNMCPRSDAGNDQQLSNGCDFFVLLDGSNSEDPQNEEISYAWSSLNGFDENFDNPNSPNTSFTFPSTDSDEIFSFILTVTDSEQSDADTVRVVYLDNDAPIAIAGNNIINCEYQFYVSGRESYDVNKNSLSFSWSSLDGLEISETSADRVFITSPVDLDEDSSYRLALEVFDGSCYGYDTTLITIKHNLCPIADAGQDKRIPKYQAQTVNLDASFSNDADGQIVSYEWTAPQGLSLIHI